jgi:hypothetical protein
MINMLLQYNAFNFCNYSCFMNIIMMFSRLQPCLGMSNSINLGMLISVFYIVFYKCVAYVDI